MSQILSKKTYNFCVLVYSVVFGLSLYFYYPYFLEIEFNLYFIFEFFWKSIYINLSFFALVFLIIKYKNLTLSKEILSNIEKATVNKFFCEDENLFLILNYIGIILGLILHLFIMFIGGVISIIFGAIKIRKNNKGNKIYGLMLIGIIETTVFIFSFI